MCICSKREDTDMTLRQINHLTRSFCHEKLTTGVILGCVKNMRIAVVPQNQPRAWLSQPLTQEKHTPILSECEFPYLDLGVYDHVLSSLWSKYAYEVLSVHTFAVAENWFGEINVFKNVWAKLKFLGLILKNVHTFWSDYQESGPLDPKI